eukprot:1142764-Alexandrium_andersonii.AAC.1
MHPRGRPAETHLPQPPEVGIRVGREQLDDARLLQGPGPNGQVPLEEGMPRHTTRCHRVHKPLTELPNQTSCGS